MNVAIATGYPELDIQLNNKIEGSKIINYKEFLLDEKNGPFDVIITSKHLSGDISERDFLFYLKDKDIRIIYITNENDDDSVLTCFEFSIHDMIFDPITSDKVIYSLEHPKAFSDVSTLYIKYLDKKNNKNSPSKLKVVGTEPEIINETTTITREKIVGTLVISVAGLQHGSGTTNTTIVLANFLAKKGFKVGVVELKKKNEYALIYLPKQATYDSCTFRYKHNIDIYANDGDSDSNDLLIAATAREYDYLILDTGLLFNYDVEKAKLDKPYTPIKKYQKSVFYNEFMKADLKIITTFASTQFADSIEYFFNYVRTWNINNLELLFNFSSSDLVNHYEKILDYNVFSIPFNPSDNLSDEEIEVYSKVLKRIIPKEKTEWKQQLSKGVKKFYNLLGRKGAKKDNSSK